MYNIIYSCVYGASKHPVRTIRVALMMMIESRDDSDTIGIGIYLQ